MRRAFLMLTAVMLAGPAQAQEPDAAVADWQFTPRARQAINKGLDWLAGQQQPNGGFLFAKGRESAGITGLAGLAFLSADAPVGKNPYAGQIAKATDFLLAGADKTTGFLVGSGQGDTMYDHGFATLFLAKVLARTEAQEPRRRLEPAVALAVKLIVHAQGKEGGWRYQPVPADGDVSVTACQLMALAAAREAGIRVPDQTIANGLAYVHKAQNEDGGFKYTLVGGPSALPRSAAALAALCYCGPAKDEAIGRAIGYVGRSKPPADAPIVGYAYYWHYYAALALRQRGGKDWQEWYPAVRDALVKSQAADGSWNGAIWQTPMALVVLQLPGGLFDPPKKDANEKAK